ncbi:major facilitator superfamily protein [Actinidia rufa]|uniref:Major facilitator superfamily protein n=1 Tax=Actinidia rufa TaxID=165716 RepID=A0A7J0DRV0_9ERIC|nr:major facilitator superfamily protein [Actinidia rufa]
MGLVGINHQENGNGGEMGLSGGKNKYKRMSSELTADEGGFDHQKERSTRKYVFACAVFASLNSVLLGYDVGVMSGAILFIHEDLKITEKMDHGISCLCVPNRCSHNDSCSYFPNPNGRTALGWGRNWFWSHDCPGLYIVEISPTVARGSLTSFPEIFINLGILLGYISNYAFSGLPSHTNWRIMLAVGILPSVFIAFALCIIPESPRWLVMQNRVEEARSVLLKTNDNEAEVEERLAEILLAAGKYEEKAVWRELLSPSPSLRRMLVTGFGIQCFQQITGIDATVYYSPTIFKEAGVEAKSKLLAATVAVGVSKTAFILVAIFLIIDRVGRKPLLYVSTIGMTICLFGLGITLSLFKEAPFGIGMAVLAVCGNVAFFSVGIGPVCWVLTSEIFPLRLRAQATALGAVGNRVCSGLVAMSFLSVARAITVAGTFFIFSAISALSVAFVYALVPETKGKSLEQIELLFQGEHGWEGKGVELGDVEHLVQKE